MNLASFPFLVAVAATLSFADQLSFGRTDNALEWAMAGTLTSSMRRGRGRPRKFEAPSRAVTLTLPEWALSALSQIHDDISKAVVHLTQRRSAQPARPLAELSVFGRHAVITVRPTPSLENHAGVRLVPLPDGRALMTFDQPTTIADLELTLHDALEETDLPDTDRQVFEEVVRILKDARRSRDVTLHRRNIIVLESSSKGRANGR
jgi:hypothetical protein